MNDINTLMARIEEINAMPVPVGADAIDELIALHRRRRGLASDGKGKRTTSKAADSIMASILDEIKSTTPKPKPAESSLKLDITLKF